MYRLDPEFKYMVSKFNEDSSLLDSPEPFFPEFAVGTLAEQIRHIQAAANTGYIDELDNTLVAAEHTLLGTPLSEERKFEMIQTLHSWRQTAYINRAGFEIAKTELEEMFLIDYDYSLWVAQECLDQVISVDSGAIINVRSEYISDSPVLWSVNADVAATWVADTRAALAEEFHVDLAYCLRQLYAAALSDAELIDQQSFYKVLDYVRQYSQATGANVSPDILAIKSLARGRVTLRNTVALNVRDFYRENQLLIIPTQGKHVIQ